MTQIFHGKPATERFFLIDLFKAMTAKGITKQILTANLFDLWVTEDFIWALNLNLMFFNVSLTGACAAAE